MPISLRLALLLALAAVLAAPAAAQPAHPAAPAAPRPPATEPAIVAVELPPAADAAPAAVQLAANTAPAAVQPAAATGALPARTLPDGTTYEPLAGFAAPELADAPITLLREGMLRGRRIAVYAVAAGGPTPVALAAALSPDARPVDAAALARIDRAPFATGATPPDPAAAQPAVRLTVSAPGLQTVDAAALAAAGLNLAGLDPATLRLRRLGREVALEEVRGAGNALEALRFYAEPGDRWNSTAIYWLITGQGPGARMEVRDARFRGASVVDTAVERGAWRTNTILETRLPGPDGDHFFSVDLRTAPLADGGVPAAAQATLAPRLPLAPGEAALTVGGGSLFGGAHTLVVDVAGTNREYRWSGKGVWSTRLLFPAGAGEAGVTLLPASAPDGIHLDAVAWELPVRLELGGQGARFEGRPGLSGYRLAALPAGAALYDVSDPDRPARLLFDGDTFEDGGFAPRSYLVAGPGTIQTPAASAHTASDLSAPLNVAAIYIAPRDFLPALEPLLAHRRAQGISTAAVSVEAIYDAWSFGLVNPEAIRSFLRFAAERWAQAPTTVILVGDGNSDPRDYLGRGNLTRIPPYLAQADPWLGETACDACYARLNGDDPLRDAPPDLMFGRLPAKSAAELEALVAKILAYERSSVPGVWRATVALIADNPDLGGNFAAAAERSAALQPAGTRFNRVFYDPDAPPGDPAREADPLLARARTMGAFDAGAAIVQFWGHGLQFQWAYTGPPLRPGEPTDKQNLLGLFDVDELNTGPRLPVVLAMTCLTGSFQIPAFSGTSIDERLVVRPDGGAIAAWSSTGLGVLFGHDALQRGFYRALWAAPNTAHLGELTMAGYLELLTAERCCQESVGTFALLGDPLTAVKVDPGVNVLTMPLVRR